MSFRDRLEDLEFDTDRDEGSILSFDREKALAIAVFLIPGLTLFGIFFRRADCLLGGRQFLLVGDVHDG